LIEKGPGRIDESSPLALVAGSFLLSPPGMAIEREGKGLSRLI